MHFCKFDIISFWFRKCGDCSCGQQAIHYAGVVWTTHIFLFTKVTSV